MKSLLILALGASVAAAQSPSTSPDGASWMRYPAISPDGKTIAFTFKGDLYKVSSAGGTATPLTIAHGERLHAGVESRRQADRLRVRPLRQLRHLRHQRRRRRGEAPHLPLGATNTRTASRPTTRASSSAPRARTPRRTASFRPASLPELYRGARGGRTSDSGAHDARRERRSTSKNGQFLIYEDKKGQENQWRKHHTSAVARDIWIYDRKAGTHRQITTFAGEDRNPVFTDDDKAFYYLSEESGSFNVHKMSVDGGKSQQLTSFKGVPVRFLSIADNGTLALRLRRSDLHDGRRRSAAEARHRRLGGQPSEQRAHHVGEQRRAGARRRRRSGKEVAFTYRGDVFVNSVEGGGTKRITTTPENGERRRVRARRQVAHLRVGARRQVGDLRSASHARRRAVLLRVDRREGSAGHRRTNIRTRIRAIRPTARSSRTSRIATPQDPQPRDEADAHAPHRQGAVRRRSLTSSGAPTASGFSSISTCRASRRVKSVSFAPTATGKVINLTESGFNDARGKWILGGKAMLWFSNRDGLKSVAQSGTAQQDAYAMFFDREAWERFRLNEGRVRAREGSRRQGREDARPIRSRRRADSARAEKKDLVLDLDGLDERKARLTVASSSLGDALVSKDGEMLYYLARFEKGMNLWSTNLRTKETKMVLTLNANGGNMAWDKEQKYIFLLADGAISRIDPTSAEARHGRDERRGSARRRRRARGDVRSRVAADARHVLLEGLSRHRLGRPASGLREVSAVHRQQLRVRRDARRDAR